MRKIEKNKILIICGPTATGKTGVGIKLAKKFGGEIVSADSRQVYKGMDIGTGKDLPKNSKFEILNPKQFQISNFKFQIGYYLFEKIPVWMLDVATPVQEFSVAQYVELTWKVISDIWNRGKLPILVGGTGFYIKGLVDEIETLGIPPNWEFRRKLEKLSLSSLIEMLARIDSLKMAAMNVSDRQNPRRLIRAIEIAMSKEKFGPQKNQKSGNEHKMDTFFIGLTAPYKVLYQRIDNRIDKQVKMGAEGEVENLLTLGYSFDLPAMSAMGYGVWKPYFEKKIPKEEIIKRWKYDEHAYVRRQMTWFRRDSRINWFDIALPNWQAQVEREVKQWYNQAHETQKG